MWSYARARVFYIQMSVLLKPTEYLRTDLLIDRPEQMLCQVGHLNLRHPVRRTGTIGINMLDINTMSIENIG